VMRHCGGLGSESKGNFIVMRLKSSQLVKASPTGVLGSSGIPRIGAEPPKSCFVSELKGSLLLFDPYSSANKATFF
jgi:hypothetical protein